MVWIKEGGDGDDGALMIMSVVGYGRRDSGYGDGDSGDRDGGSGGGMVVWMVVMALAVAKVMCVVSRTRLLIYLCAMPCTTEFSSLGAEYLTLVTLNFLKVN